MRSNNDASDDATMVISIQEIREADGRVIYHLDFKDGTEPVAVDIVSPVPANVSASSDSTIASKETNDRD